MTGGLGEALLAACMFLVAALYTTVGHAGASGYLALMGLFGVEPAVMRPTALVLNIVVSSFTVVAILARQPVSLARVVAIFDRGDSRWVCRRGDRPAEPSLSARRGHHPFHRRRAFPVATAVSGLSRGARSPDPSRHRVRRRYRTAVRLDRNRGRNISFAVVVGYGLVGSPHRVRRIGPFYLVCLHSRIAGKFSSRSRALPSELPLYVSVVLAGAVVGTTLGTGRLSTSGVLKALGLVLIVAGFKLVGFY